MYTPIRLIPWAVMLSKFLNVDEETGIGIYEFATANYVGVWGTYGGADGIHTCGTLAAGQQCLSDSCFFHNGRIRFADILDGLSQTFHPGSGRRDADHGLNGEAGESRGGDVVERSKEGVEKRMAVVAA